MTVFRSSKDAVIFSLDAAERRLFVEILNLYPVVPEAYQPLSRSLEEKVTREDQQLLNEALAEQRSAHRQKIKEWLSTTNRFRHVDSGFNFTLRRIDAEWLLQALNDIRVGCWLLLGSPDNHMGADDLQPLDPALHRTWAAMELSGMFQMEILHGLEGSLE